ncbi:MAG: helix-turn-helix transcriptional regulator [Sphingomonadales bacterium]|nr:helix-turn-helix transcriptional regulator [Sphingomonadales bacterium]
MAVGWDWLAARGVAREAVLGGRGFVQGDWPASPEEVALAEQLVALDRGGPAAGGAAAGQQIAREAAVLALVARLVGRLLAPSAGAGLSPAEAERLGRIEAFAARPGPLPPLAEMAGAAGLSLSSARRLFRRAYGLSIGARLSDLRMAQAEAALARGARVAEAAHLAGFASAESFATAFKRKFGLSPSELRPGGRR